MKPSNPGTRTYVKIVRGKGAGATGFFNGTWRDREAKAEAWRISPGDIKCFVYGTGEATRAIRMANLVELTPFEVLMMKDKGELV